VDFAVCFCQLATFLGFATSSRMLSSLFLWLEEEEEEEEENQK